MTSEPLARLLALEQFGIKLGLDNIRTLTAALGHPERTWPCVLVAGTNGKGSVTAMVERALRATGRRTGRYTSPHLVHLNERIAIDGVPVDDAQLADAVEHVLNVEAGCRADGRLPAHVTFFEAVTATAFEVFRRSAVDVAVLEVGLGGRFDATNVVSPVATAIVSIDVDHTRHLGATRGEIAAEKAGIAKPGAPMIVGDMAPDAAEVVEEICRQAGAPVVHAAEGAACLLAEPAHAHAEMQVSTATRTYGSVRLALAGRHQVRNALVALRLLEEIDSQGLSVDGAAIETGLREARWPGRLERIAFADGRELLLDAAHNPSGARALAEYLAAEWPNRPTLVLAVSGDKDVAGILAALTPGVGDIVLTRFAGSRSADPASLAALVADPSSRRVSIEDSARTALERAMAGSTQVVVAGSMFLLGELLPYIEELRQEP